MVKYIIFVTRDLFILLKTYFCYDKLTKFRRIFMDNVINSTISVCIIDDNIDFCAELTSFLHNRLFVNVIGVTYDGETALKLLNICKPDVILLDITLPKLDGLEVLKRAKTLLPDSGVIVLYSRNRNNVVQKANKFGADHCICKPFNMAQVSTIITKLYYSYLSKIIENYIQDLDNGVENPAMLGLNNSENVPIHFYIGIFLARLKFSPKLKGYFYFQSAITQVINDNSLINNITKILYKNIADEFSTNDRAVERSMRNAVSEAWKSGGGVIYYQILGYSLPEDPIDCVKPTNSHLISNACNFFAIEFSKYYKNNLNLSRQSS